VARKGVKTVIRYVKAKTSGRRRAKNSDLKKYAKKAALGTVAGLAVAIPISLAAKFMNIPQLVEVADRAGAVAATLGGGTVGQIGYQFADSIFDRFVIYNGGGVSGGRQVYL